MTDPKHQAELERKLGVIEWALTCCVSRNEAEGPKRSSRLVGEASFLKRRELVRLEPRGVVRQ